MTIAQAQAAIDGLFAALEKRAAGHPIVLGTLRETNVLFDAALPAVVAQLPSEASDQQLMDALFASAEIAAGPWGGLVLRLVQAEADRLLPTLYPSS